MPACASAVVPLLLESAPASMTLPMAPPQFPAPATRRLIVTSSASSPAWSGMPNFPVAARCLPKALPARRASMTGFVVGVRANIGAEEGAEGVFPPTSNGLPFGVTAAAGAEEAACGVPVGTSNGLPEGIIARRGPGESPPCRDYSRRLLRRSRPEPTCHDRPLPIEQRLSHEARARRTARPSL